MNSIGKWASVLVIGFTALTSAVQADTLDDVMKAGVIRLAATQEFPPYGFLSKEQKIIGYDTDFAEMISKELKVRYEQIPATPANRFPMLQTKKVDLIVAALAWTAEREKVVDFSDPYGAIYQGVFGPKSLAVSKIADLVGKTVAVVRGTTQDIELSAIAPAGTQIRRFEDNNTAFTAYVTAQVELLATGNNLAKALGSKAPSGEPDLKIPLAALPIGVGILKGDVRMKQRINALIAAKKKSGELDEMSKKWFGMPIPEFKKP